MSASFVTAALRYARDGYPVLPVMPGEKQPLTSRGLHDATTDERTIVDWWNRWPEANIGLRTGVVHDVLDVDNLDHLEELVGGPGIVFDAGPCVHTPSGGVHVWYAPTGFGCKVKFTPGLDWRGENGYAIAPPSRTDAGVYEWDEQFGYERELFVVPPWLYRLLDPQPTTPPKPAELASASGKVKGKYAAAALRNETDRVARASTGRRNDTLVRASFALGQLVCVGALDPDETFGALLNAALKAGLAESEARRTIRSGIEAGAQRPRTA